MDDDLRSTLWAAHDQAVADALGYMERQAAVTRRGPAGVHAIATLATRRGNDYRVTPEQLVPQWRERARSLGLTLEAIRALGERTGAERLDDELVAQILERLAGPQGLTRDRSTFTRRDVLQALSERLPGPLRPANP